MPADPIDYRIWLNRRTALQAIRKSGGYHHDVMADVALKLDPDHRVEELIAVDGPRPFLMLELGEETWTWVEKPNLVDRALPATIHWVNGPIDPDTDESRLMMHLKACADIETALAVDQGCGALARACEIRRRRYAAVGSDIWTQVDIVITTRHTYGAPNGSPS